MSTRRRLRRRGSAGRRRRAVRGALLLPVLLVALGGCTGGGDVALDRGAGRPAATSTTVAEPPAGRPRGGSARVGVWAEPDPAAGAEGPGAWAVRPLVHAQLFALTPEGVWEPRLVRPGSVRETPAATWASFRLRDGAVWSDGSAITVDDLRRSADPRFVADVAEVPAGAPGQPATRIRVGFTQPLPGWRRLWSLTDVVAPPAPGVWGGPFLVAGRTPGLELVLAPNDRWWGRGPWLDEVRLVLVPEQTTARQLLARGELDVVMPHPRINRTARYRDIDGVHVDVGEPGGRWTGIRLNPDLLGGRARRALTNTVDRDAFVGTLLAGEAELLRSFVPDGDTWAEDPLGPLTGLGTVEVTAYEEVPMLSLLQRAMQLRARESGERIELRNGPADVVEGWLGTGRYQAAFVLEVDPPWPCWRCRWEHVGPDLARAADAGDHRAARELEAALWDRALLLPLWRPVPLVAWRDGLHGPAANGWATSAAWNAETWWRPTPTP